MYWIRILKLTLFEMQRMERKLMEKQIVQENQRLIYTRGISVEKFLMEIKAQRDLENEKR